nr:hypothetical protein CFP56_53810 [Quercus suber]
MLLDDEELELQELEGGPNPLRCSDCFAANGVHGWSLYEDFLTDFPPNFIVKKLFKMSMLMLKSAVVLVNVILKTGASNILVYNTEINRYGICRN